jgi:hypothetical protein
MPFCESICGFCGFYRKPVAGFAADLDAVFDRFTGNLVREIRMWSECSLVRKMKVGAVYVGGGTPSTLPVANIDRILRAIRASLPVPRDVEFTFEGEVRSLNDRTKLALLREHGVSLQNLEADLQSAVDRLRCSHIDLYDTILYPNTEFFARRHYFAGLVPSDPERLEMVRFAAAYLRSRNYTQITSDDYVLPGAGYGMKFLNFGGPDWLQPRPGNWAVGDRVCERSLLPESRTGGQHRTADRSFADRSGVPRVGGRVAPAGIRLCPRCLAGTPGTSGTASMTRSDTFCWARRHGAF